MNGFSRIPRLTCFVLLGLWLNACQQPVPWQTRDISGLMPDLSFTMTDEQGKVVTEQDYRGKQVLLFFGYMHCPDICPTTLARLAGVMRQLGPAAARFVILFVSVDPLRDTPAVLAAYTKAFAPNITGLVGSTEQTMALTKRYRVAFGHDQPDANGDYAVFHSSAVYVFDARGKVRLLFTSSNTPAQILADLKQLTAVPTG